MYLKRMVFTILLSAFLSTALSMHTYAQSAKANIRVSALPPASSTVSLAGPLIRSGFPVCSHKYLIETQHWAEAGDAPHVLIWDSTGAFVDELSIQPQGATVSLLTSADVGDDGRLAIAGRAKKTDGSFYNFIGTMNLDGQNSSYFDTGNYRASLISVADDGSIWAIGAESGTKSATDPSVLTRGNYDMLRHFSAKGTLIEHFLPRWGPEVTTRTLSIDAYGNKLWQAYDAAGAAVSTTPEERRREQEASSQPDRRVFLRTMGSVTVFFDGIENRICERDARVSTTFSCMRITGSTAARYSVQTGLAITPSGTVYASLMSSYDNYSSGRGLFVLVPSTDMQSARWVQIPGEQATGLKLGDFISLIGSKGYSLALLMVVPQGGDLVVSYVTAP